MCISSTKGTQERKCASQEDCSTKVHRMEENPDNSHEAAPLLALTHDGSFCESENINAFEVKPSFHREILTYVVF